MTTRSPARGDRMLRLFRKQFEDGRRLGVSGIYATDAELAGHRLKLHGTDVVNFGSCAYLGMNLDQRLVEAAADAVRRYGPVFSSSAAYTALSMYEDLEELMTRIMGTPTVLPTTTTLGHLAALPLLVRAGDVVLVDAQAHASVQLATQVLFANGIPVAPVSHNALSELEEVVASNSDAEHVWYLADGVYSMFGDVAPVERLTALQARYPNLWIYYDDAHGFGWAGRFGRGLVNQALPTRDRTVVAVSLAKSFGSGGAAISFPDAEMAELVDTCGGTMIFSGPIHPAELGAAVASAQIHLSDERNEREDRLRDLIRSVNRMIADRGLPVVSLDETPIWFVRAGSHRQMLEVTTSLMDDGFYLNPASFPVVPHGMSGLRFTATLYHDESMFTDMFDALEKHLARVVGHYELTVDLRD